MTEPDYDDMDLADLKLHREAITKRIAKSSEQDAAPLRVQAGKINEAIRKRL